MLIVKYDVRSIYRLVTGTYKIIRLQYCLRAIIAESVFSNVVIF